MKRRKSASMYESKKFIPLVMRFLLSLQLDCLTLQSLPMLAKRRKRNGKEPKTKQINTTMFNLITTCSEKCTCIFIVLYYHRDGNFWWKHINQQDSESTTCSKNSLEDGCALTLGTVLCGYGYAQYVEQYLLYDLKTQLKRFQILSTVLEAKSRVSKSQPDTHHLLCLVDGLPCFMTVLLFPVRIL